METKNTPPYTFTSQVLFDPTVEDGYMKHYVPISGEVAALLQEATITHVEGTINSHEFRRSIHIRPDGSTCLKFGKIWLEQANLRVDMEVVVELAPDPEPDRIDLPEELTSALMQASEDIVQAWANLSPSRQKTLAYGIDRAKTSETRRRRANAIIEELRQNI